jgi:HAD superfamily hydrolase (TIGR01509 family)
MNNGGIRGVILDLDGTLLDSMPLWHEIDLQFLTENGIEPPENISEIVGKMSITEWADYFIRTFRMPYTPEYVIRRIEELAETAYRESIPEKPYVRKFLDALDEAHIPYGVATATYRNSAMAALRRLGLWERMQFVLTGEDVPSGKKNPEIYLLAAQKLGTQPHETLVVEDALHCVRTAAAAGFLTAGVYDAAILPEEWDAMQETCTLTGCHLLEILGQI